VMVVGVRDAALAEGVLRLRTPGSGSTED